MKRSISVFIGLFFLVVFSCKKGNNVEPIILSESDYLMFGHFYGECGGANCIRIFRLESNQLLEDTRDIYPSSNNFYDGNFVLLSQQRLNIAKDLVNDFPMDLLNEPKNVIGQPDAGDWGGLYIEYNYKGVRKFWLLDQMKSNVPTKYHNFIDKINDKIRLLR
jgi:hypothetical protein